MKSNLKFTLCQHLTLSEQVTNYLRREIITGILPGGSALKQDELAKRYGVSISSLREALKNLEGEELIEFTANRGAAVTRLSARDAEEIFELRCLLETNALGASIDALTENDFFLLEGMLDEEEFCCEPQRYNDLNLAFHAKLYAHCPNQRQLEYIARLHRNINRYMVLYLNEMAQKEKSQLEHRQLLEACRQKNKTAARQILKKHVQNAGKELASYLSKYPD